MGARAGTREGDGGEGRGGGEGGRVSRRLFTGFSEAPGRFRKTGKQASNASRRLDFEAAAACADEPCEAMLALAGVCNEVVVQGCYALPGTNVEVGAWGDSLRLDMGNLWVTCG